MRDIGIICGIYKITSPTGRIYIGQSKNIKQRFRDYNKPSGGKGQTRLYKSFLKHKIENHQFDIIEYCSIEDLNCSERFWQDEFDVLNGGLNCVLQDCNSERKKLSKETKENMRLSKLGDKNPMYGIKRTEESKKKQGDAIRGEKNTRWGKKLPEETCRKMKENHADIRGDKNPNFGKDFSGGKNPNAKKVINIETGVIYNSIKETAEIFNIKLSVLKYRLSSKGIHTNNTPLRILTEH